MRKKEMLICAITAGQYFLFYKIVELLLLQKMFDKSS